MCKCFFCFLHFLHFLRSCFFAFVSYLLNHRLVQHLKMTVWTSVLWQTKWLEMIVKWTFRPLANFGKHSLQNWRSTTLCCINWAIWALHWRPSKRLNDLSICKAKWIAIKISKLMGTRVNLTFLKSATCNLLHVWHCL